MQRLWVRWLIETRMYVYLEPRRLCMLNDIVFLCVEYLK